jgi:hypothetical protein
MDQQFPCDWEALKPEIRQMYLVENKSLKDVVAAIKTAHEIRVTYTSHGSVMIEIGTDALRLADQHNWSSSSSSGSSEKTCRLQFGNSSTMRSRRERGTAKIVRSYSVRYLYQQRKSKRRLLGMCRLLWEIVS